MSRQLKKQLRATLLNQNPSLVAGELVELRDIIETRLELAKGDKGDIGATGPQGPKGDSISGPQGVQGEKGEPGKDGENGRDGRDGRDGRTPIAGVDFVVEQPDYETPKELRDKLESLPEGTGLDYKKLRNTPTTKELAKQLKELKGVDGLGLEKMNQPAKGPLDQRWHGGGDTVVAGTNITIVRNNLGQKVISSSGGGSGGGITPETFTGAVDGVNTVFTVAHTPSLVALNGAVQESGGGDYTVSGAGPYTITFTFPPVLNSILLVYYNAGSASTLTQVNGEIPSGLVDGMNTTYTLSHIPANFKQLFYGLLLNNPAEYSISGLTITMVAPLLPGNIMQAFYEY